MRDLLKSLFRSLPAPLKAAYSRVRERNCELWVVSGREASGEPLRAGIAGDEAAKVYLVKRLFKGEVREERLGRFPRESVRARAGEGPEGPDLFFWDIPSSQEGAFSPPCFALLPGWVRLYAELSAESGFDSRRKVREIRNLVERGGLAREVTKDPARFDAFFREIYLPFVAERHEGAATPVSPSAARARFVSEDLELVLVVKDGVAIAGGVLGREDGEPAFWLMGVDGAAARKLGSVVGGAVGDAVYYHIFARAKETGAARLNMGHCRPFLEDGSMRYKRAFGSFVAGVRMPEGGLLALQISRQSAGANSWLKGNPLVAVDGAGRYSVLAFVPDAASAASAADDLRSRYCGKGGLDLAVYALEPELRLERSVRAGTGSAP